MQLQGMEWQRVPALCVKTQSLTGAEEEGTVVARERSSVKVLKHSGRKHGRVSENI